ncbi:endolytic transglycosylase MltG [Lentibacillus saliphilus]|uniref:endolytic transglycosylase MltG n=1 Tax=Lentibacillus saliphilus TaxID=2737028 RepID=UPI001FEA1F54|nr:endolytic transglycosylase MltG [Lentibacillus saliphilus]
MKYPVRTFSIGLFSAGIIMLVVYMFNHSALSQQTLSQDEMIALLKEDDFRVITEEQYIALSVDEPEEDNKAEATDDTETNDVDQTTSENEDKEADANPETDESESASEEETEDIEAEEDVDDQEAPESEATSYTLKVEPGMMSSDISKKLEEQGIIESAQEFNAYLQEHDYSLLIQIGTFKVNSAMSFYELAETITNL